MTDIAFHVNLADRLAYACRLLRKARAGGARVVVTGEAAQLRALDAALWTFSAQDFLPHCLAGEAPAVMLARTPLVLSETALAMPHQEVLVNLGAAVPEGFGGYERLIELVGDEPEQLQQARVRWKHYSARGYALSKIDPKERVA